MDAMGSKARTDRYLGTLLTTEPPSSRMRASTAGVTSARMSTSTRPPPAGPSGTCSTGSTSSRGGRRDRRGCRQLQQPRADLALRGCPLRLCGQECGDLSARSPCSRRRWCCFPPHACGYRAARLGCAGLGPEARWSDTRLRSAAHLAKRRRRSRRGQGAGGVSTPVEAETLPADRTTAVGQWCRSSQQTDRRFAAATAVHNRRRIRRPRVTGAPRHHSG